MELRRYEKTSRRLLAAIDKSVTWLTDETHCGEAIDVLVNATHARRQDTEASYNLLCQIQYFKSSRKISCGNLQNLIDAERALGKSNASLTVDRLAMPSVTEFTD
jgi:hypothetical protein